MPKLSKSVSGALREFSYWIAKGTVGHPLLDDVDYWPLLKEDPIILETAYAIFANVLELDEQGVALNAKYAEDRAAQYILERVTGRMANPPFELWEVELH